MKQQLCDLFAMLQDGLEAIRQNWLTYWMGWYGLFFFSLSTVVLIGDLFARQVPLIDVGVACLNGGCLALWMRDWWRLASTTVINGQRIRVWRRRRATQKEQP